jgi:hypothetical protein
VSCVNNSTVKPHILYLDAVRTCNSLIDIPWGWQFICRNVYRGCKYIFYLLIILCTCWFWLNLKINWEQPVPIPHCPPKIQHGTVLDRTTALWWDDNFLGNCKEVVLTCVTLFSGSFAKLRKATLSFVMCMCVCACLSVCLSAWNSSALTGQIFMKFDIWGFFEDLSGKFNFH